MILANQKFQSVDLYKMKGSGSILFFRQAFSFLAFIVFTIFLVTEITAQTPAFPGAEGFGAYSQGGRGGKLMVVTTLDDSGQGSLRAAVESEGARTIVFEVAGMITLKSALIITNPFITIAGQTAPDPGITIRGETVKISTHNVIIRFLRFRPGNINPREDDADWGNFDALDIGLKDSDQVHDIIIDHCSISWATDENIGVWEHTKNLTIQNSIISEPLHNFPGHEKYPYPGQGLLIGLQADQISVIKNLFAHNYERHPYHNANGHLDFRNNVIYNAGGYVAKFHNAAGKLQTVNYVNNYIIPGPSSKYEKEVLIRRTSQSRMYNGKIFLEGNISEGHMLETENNWAMVIDEESGAPYPDSHRSDTEFEAPHTSTLPAEQLINEVLPAVGAYLPARDQIDKRILLDLNNREGNLISTPQQVLGWPKVEKISESIDPGNRWQNQHKIDLFDEQQANADFNGNGYANIEEFLNGTDPYKDESELHIHEIFLPNSEFTSHAVSSVRGTDNLQKEIFDIQQIYPNPFINTTNLHITIEEYDYYKLEIYNTIGQKIASLLDQHLGPGSYETTWNAKSFPSGLYFARLSSGNSSTIRKLILLK